jgi:hypothetical protein
VGWLVGWQAEAPLRQLLRTALYKPHRGAEGQRGRGAEGQRGRGAEGQTYGQRGCLRLKTVRDAQTERQSKETVTGKQTQTDSRDTHIARHTETGGDGEGEREREQERDRTTTTR